MALRIENVGSKSVIVTGGANGIGAQSVRTFHQNGANVIIADLPSERIAAETLISSLSEPSRALYIPTDILNWNEMKSLYQQSIDRFGRVDIVVANAGAMESKEFYDFETDERGDLKEPIEAYRIVDINLKGTMTMHHMRSNPTDSDGFCGSVVLIASTSGYFGGTGVVSYVTSKHGVVGLLRASQRAANKLRVRVNVVAPFFTPTHITSEYSEKWRVRGLPANTVEDVAFAIVQTAVNPGMKGQSCLVAGKQTREIEDARAAMVPQWVGEDIARLMADAGEFFDDIGGYPLPKARL
ncbi:NAD(P)-binding protein [Lepidopterella palustris CBS 459.81]|uniref:NAD(P)-binding protein n=1 Tax=Lepidopterella palustris CBS 459.81 TaxID=1314670 RepID=A0A8E2E001_9PEZI|nr:NAD(P)-binding protein [Lepidopterella palustris CBS 459.81]